MAESDFEDGGIIDLFKESYQTLRNKKVPVYITVNDTRLARKIYPNFMDNGDGTITVIKEYSSNAVILGKEEGFTYEKPTLKDFFFGIRRSREVT